MLCCPIASISSSLIPWSLPRPRKPRPSPEKARFLFLLAPYANRAQAMCRGDAICGLQLGGSPPARCRLINADETTLSALLPPEIVRAAVRGGRPQQVGLSFLAKCCDRHRFVVPKRWIVERTLEPYPITSHRSRRR